MARATIARLEDELDESRRAHEEDSGRWQAKEAALLAEIEALKAAHAKVCVAAPLCA